MVLYLFVYGSKEAGRARGPDRDRIPAANGCESLL